MPRVRSDAGIKHMTNFGLLLEPVDELQSVALMALEAHLKRAQSAMHEVAIVGAHAVSPVTRRILQPPEDVGIRRGHCAEHDVGMSRQIFGSCSDRHIDTMFNRTKIERGSPGVIDNCVDLAWLRPTMYNRPGRHRAGIQNESDSSRES